MMRYVTDRTFTRPHLFGYDVRYQKKHTAGADAPRGKENAPSGTAAGTAAGSNAPANGAAGGEDGGQDAVVVDGERFGGPVECGVRGERIVPKDDDPSTQWFEVVWDSPQSEGVGSHPPHQPPRGMHADTHAPRVSTPCTQHKHAAHVHVAQWRVRLWHLPNQSVAACAPFPLSLPRRLPRRCRRSEARLWP